MFTFMASSRISGAMYLWGTQGQFAGAAPTKGCPATCQSPVSPRGAGSSALPSPGIQGDQDERHTMGQRAPFHSRDCNLVTQRQGGTGDTAGGEAVRSHPTSCLTHLLVPTRGFWGMSMVFSTESCFTASPRSAMAQVSFLFTRMFLDFRSRCAIAGFPVHSKRNHLQF